MKNPEVDELYGHEKHHPSGAVAAMRDRITEKTNRRRHEHDHVVAKLKTEPVLQSLFGFAKIIECLSSEDNDDQCAPKANRVVLDVGWAANKLEYGV
ncbi:hypothetical protein PINS_up009008 [Pythium insidiosum]|nr:hypothetical protein PINS_up009008 [Pythium insidiosum]